MTGNDVLDVTKEIYSLLSEVFRLSLLAGQGQVMLEQVKTI